MKPGSFQSGNRTKLVEEAGKTALPSRNPAEGHGKDQKLWTPVSSMVPWGAVIFLSFIMDMLPPPPAAAAQLA